MLWSAVSLGTPENSAIQKLSVIIVIIMMIIINTSYWNIKMALIAAHRNAGIILVVTV